MYYARINYTTLRNPPAPPVQVASQFDEHHTFMVQYKQGQDLGLDMHTDDSVTRGGAQTHAAQGGMMTTVRRRMA